MPGMIHGAMGKNAMVSTSARGQDKKPRIFLTSGVTGSRSHVVVGAPQMT